MQVFKFLPNPVIASMLMISCVNLGKASWSEIKKFKEKGETFNIITLICTCTLCVIFDGAIGLSIGLTIRIIIKCFTGGFKQKDDQVVKLEHELEEKKYDEREEEEDKVNKVE